MALKKIKNDVLEQMLKDGKSQREIARYFNCSDAAVSKIIKRWQAAEPPDSFKMLTAKKQKFVLARLSGKSNTASALESYDCGSLGSARQLGQRLKADPEVNTAYRDLLYQVGIGKRRRAERLRDIVEAKDLSVSTRGIELAAKLCGELVGNNIDVTINNYDPRTISAGIQELRAMIDENKKDQIIDVTEEGGN